MRDAGAPRSVRGRSVDYSCGLWMNTTVMLGVFFGRTRQPMGAERVLHGSTTPDMYAG
jgi:hypothetical protein